MSRETKLRGTEVKVGLSVLALLFVGVVVVLVLKFRGPEQLPAAHINTAWDDVHAQPAPGDLASGPAQPTVLESQDIDTAAAIESVSKEPSADWSPRQSNHELPSIEVDEQPRSFMPRSTAVIDSDDAPSPATESATDAHAAEINASDDAASATLQQMPENRSTSIRPSFDVPDQRYSTNPLPTENSADSARTQFIASQVDGQTEPFSATTQRNPRYGTAQVAPAQQSQTTPPPGSRYDVHTSNAQPTEQRSTATLSPAAPRQFKLATPPSPGAASDANARYAIPANAVRQTANAVQTQNAQQGSLRRPAKTNTGKTIVEPGDSLWTISQRVYGTGAFFKAIQEHNRQRFPNGHDLKIGDEVVTPEPMVLRKKYPGLCPRERKRRPPTLNLTSVNHRSISSGRSYVVEEGDTLYDIARYELGAGGRWPEIYDLNRERLAHDFDYLRPGIKLVLPGKPTPQNQDALTRNPDQIRR